MMILIRQKKKTEFLLEANQETDLEFGNHYN